MARANYLILTMLALTAGACEEPECPPGRTRVGTQCRSPRNEEGADAALLPTGSARMDASQAYAADAETTHNVTNRDGSLEALGDAMVSTTEPDSCTIDRDADGYASSLATSCPASGALKPGDCDDTNSAVHPGAKEVCGDAIDNDCDGDTDEAEPEQCNGIDDDCDPTTADGDQACGDFACRDAKCLTSCATDDDCADGRFCADGHCGADNDGASCSDSAQCTSGWCCMYGECAQVNSCALSPGKECQKNFQCGSYTCVKTCQFHKSNYDEVCDENGDCATSPLRLVCVTDRCKLDARQPCQQDNQCAYGKCLGGSCALRPVSPLDCPCNVKDDCAPALLCEPASLKCKKVPGGSCTASAQCYPGFECLGGYCTMSPG